MLPQLDSFMGATIQRTRYSNTAKRILTDESPEPTKSADIKVVSGLNILTNNQVRPDNSTYACCRRLTCVRQVNLLSSIVVALVLGVMA